MSTAPLRGCVPVTWEELVRCKSGYFRSLAHYNIAAALLAASSVVSAADRNRLVHMLINAHSRVAATEHTLTRRPVYTDAAVETSYGRLQLGNCVSGL